MSLSLFSVVLTILFNSITAINPAGDTSWEKIEYIPGHYVSSITSVGDYIAVGTWDSGLYLCNNWCEQCKEYPEIFKNVRIYSTKSIAESLYVCTDGEGIYQSIDFGRRWTTFNKGLDDPHVFSIAITDSVFIASTWKSGIFRCSRNSQTWNKIEGETKKRIAYSLYSQNDKVFAGTSRNGLIISDVNGLEWADKGLDHQSVLSLAGRKQVLYAGTWDKGLNKCSINDFLWHEIGLQGIPVQAITMDDAVVYAGTHGSGVYNCSTVDSCSSIGLKNSDITALGYCEPFLYAGTWGDGLYRKRLHPDRVKKKSIIDTAESSVGSDYKRSASIPSHIEIHERNRDLVVSWNLSEQSDISFIIAYDAAKTTRKYVRAKLIKGNFSYTITKLKPGLVFVQHNTSTPPKVFAFCP